VHACLSLRHVIRVSSETHGQKPAAAGNVPEERLSTILRTKWRCEPTDTRNLLSIFNQIRLSTEKEQTLTLKLLLILSLNVNNPNLTEDEPYLLRYQSHG
jgi:hypothetical protein